jgi:hypothetical protein
VPCSAASPCARGICPEADLGKGVPAHCSAHGAGDVAAKCPVIGRPADCERVGRGELARSPGPASTIDGDHPRSCAITATRVAASTRSGGAARRRRLVWLVCNGRADEDTLSANGQPEASTEDMKDAR